MRKCPNCGANNSDYSYYCSNCGTKLIEIKEPVEGDFSTYQNPTVHEEEKISNVDVVSKEKRKEKIEKNFALAWNIIGIIVFVFAIATSWGVIIVENYNGVITNYTAIDFLFNNWQYIDGSGPAYLNVFLGFFSVLLNILVCLALGILGIVSCSKNIKNKKPFNNYFLLIGVMVSSMLFPSLIMSQTYDVTIDSFVFYREEGTMFAVLDILGEILLIGSAIVHIALSHDKKDHLKSLIKAFQLVTEYLLLTIPKYFGESFAIEFNVINPTALIEHSILACIQVAIEAHDYTLLAYSIGGLVFIILAIIGATLMVLYTTKNLHNNDEGAISTYLQFIVLSGIMVFLNIGAVTFGALASTRINIYEITSFAGLGVISFLIISLLLLGFNIANYCIYKKRIKSQQN